MTDIELTIDTIYVEGLGSLDRERLAWSVQSELSRLFSSGGIPAGLRHGRTELTLRAGPIEIHPQDRPEAIGKKIANVVYRGLS